MRPDTFTVVPIEPIPSESVLAGSSCPDIRPEEPLAAAPCCRTTATEQEQADADTAWLNRLTEAQAGKSEVIGWLIDQVRDYLLLVASRELNESLRAKVSASDVVQQTMLEAACDFKKFRGQSEGELNGWLIRILRHNLADVARRFCGTQSRDLSREISGLADPSAPLVSNLGSPSSICRKVESDQELDRAVMRLPEHYQRVLHLRHVQDLSWNEVALQLNISADAARKLWARTLGKLRQELAGDA